MKLTIKLTAAATVMVLAVLAVNAIIRVKREIALFESDIHRDHRLLAWTLAGAVERTWSTIGEAAARDLVTDANARKDHVEISWHSVGASALSPDARRAVESGSAHATRIVRQHGAQEYATVVPVKLGGQTVAAIEVRESLEAEREYVRHTLAQITVTSIVLVVMYMLLATVLGMLLVGRPVRNLVAQARRIGEGDLSPQPVSRSTDEIGMLAREMDAMRRGLLDARTRVDAEISARLSAQHQLRHAERLSTVGKLAAGLAHEIGTPLNVITGHAQLIVDDQAGSPARHAAVIAEQAARVTRIIRQLLDFARQRTPHKERHDVVAISRRVVAVLDAMAQKRDVELTVTPAAPGLYAEVDEVQLQQVLTNLVVNAIQSFESPGTVDVSIERAAEEIAITVADDGPGIPEELRHQIFEPFFTTKDVGDGTGLGLAVAHGIVEEHGGSIEVDSEVGRGARFTVRIPGAVQ